jgi:hypothetical protein
MISGRTEDMILKPTLVWCKSYLKIPAVSFGRPERLANGSWRFKLTGEGATQAEARERYPAFFLLEKSENLFWFALACDFERIAGSVKLRSISLLFFVGEATDTRKVPLLRAEWDFYITTEHAQPHWHVYQLGIEEPPDTPELEEWQITSLQKFHFAIGSRWVGNQFSPHSALLTSPDALRDWISRCLPYVHAELRYI